MELTGINVLKVRALPGEFDYAKGTKMEGKKYRRYAVDGKAFISPVEDAVFHEAVLNGKLHTVVLGTNELDQLSLSDYITWNQAIGYKRNQTEFDSITPESYKPTTIQQYEELS
jgi:hypothetical protein